jgi:hypothetical protein
MVKMLVYTNGGNTHHGHLDFTPTKLKAYGKSKNQKWMYKGYRWWSGVRDIVVVFDTEEWTVYEKAKRKINGFLGIRETRL